MAAPPTATKLEFSAKTLRVLLIGEREEDFFQIREILARNRSFLPAELDHAHSLDEAKAMLRQTIYGLVLFEHETGDVPGLRLLTEFLHCGATVPFILLTEQADERTVAEIIQAGAWDSMEKSRLDGPSLVRAIRSTLNLHSIQQERQLAEESVRKLSRAVEQSADIVFITDREGLIEYVNPAFEALTGYSPQEVVGKTPRVLDSGEPEPQAYRALWQTVLSGNVYRSILAHQKKNGECFQVEESVSPIRDAAGCITHIIYNGRDLTERLRLEEQLLQAQKMDAIGRLAGGVAHDFNNLLTIITSYSELALDSVIPGTPLRDKIQEILSAARRAAELTRQLLAFSRKQPQALRVVELNPVVGGIVKTLHRLIGEDIELTFAPGLAVGRVCVDPVQIEQILMNLAANSRDAMPRGGQVTIETSHAVLDDQYIQHKRAIIPIGPYALVTVSDSGMGIPPGDLSHIFEPFYTTKPAGKGTGLGLATVYGIVKQNRGFVWAYSEPGMGTIFKIYLPCVQQRSAAVEPPEPKTEPLLHGDETILLVEDEDSVRRASAEFLNSRGYTVLEARDGLHALAVSANYGSPIHIVVTDVVMPHMSGGQLAKELEVLRPNVKVLFVSGYAGKTLSDHAVIDLETNFLQKPFTLKQLSDKVRTVLERGARTLLA